MKRPFLLAIVVTLSGSTVFAQNTKSTSDHAAVKQAIIRESIASCSGSSPPHPNEIFARQVIRALTAADDGWLVGHRVLICDRDTKSSAVVRAQLREAEIRVAHTPHHAPNANAYAELFVRSIKNECLNRVIPFGERHFRRTIAEYVAH